MLFLPAEDWFNEQILEKRKHLTTRTGFKEFCIAAFIKLGASAQTSAERDLKRHDNPDLLVAEMNGKGVTVVTVQEIGNGILRQTGA